MKIFNQFLYEELKKQKIKDNLNNLYPGIIDKFCAEITNEYTKDGSILNFEYVPNKFDILTVDYIESLNKLSNVEIKTINKFYDYLNSIYKSIEHKDKLVKYYESLFKKLSLKLDKIKRSNSNGINGSTVIPFDYKNIDFGNSKIRIINDIIYPPLSNTTQTGATSVYYKKSGFNIRQSGDECYITPINNSATSGTAKLVLDIGAINNVTGIMFESTNIAFSLYAKINGVTSLIASGLTSNGAFSYTFDVIKTNSLMIDFNTANKLPNGDFFASIKNISVLLNSSSSEGIIYTKEIDISEKSSRIGVLADNPKLITSAVVKLNDGNWINLPVLKYDSVNFSDLAIINGAGSYSFVNAFIDKAFSDPHTVGDTFYVNVSSAEIGVGDLFDYNAIMLREIDNFNANDYIGYIGIINNAVCTNSNIFLGETKYEANENLPAGFYKIESNVPIKELVFDNPNNIILSKKYSTYKSNELFEEFENGYTIYDDKVFIKSYADNEQIKFLINKPSELLPNNSKVVFKIKFDIQNKNDQSIKYIGGIIK